MLVDNHQREDVNLQQSCKKKHVGTPQPYQLPGYSGHCPDVQFRLGPTFGLATHQTMCDPNVSHARNLALSRLQVQDLGDDYGTGILIKKSELRKQLQTEVVLLKGTRRLRNVHDRMMIDSPRLPLTSVTEVYQGYKHPV